MLNPNNDRLDYGNILSPPLNYELDFAIGTTYSLDLDSLVSASIALGLSEETDTNLRKNPLFLLKALLSTEDKIALFCENGRIKNPSYITELYILLEEMVFQVNTPKKEYITSYPSFHPKFWLIRYINKEKEVIYRIIVLSRNLTFDRSWDISFTMDGKKLENNSNLIKEKNKNLTIFLNYLNEYSTSVEKTNKINEIIEELASVEFDLNTNTFEDFDFIPNGVSDTVSLDDFLKFSEGFDDLVIISPFLSGGCIKRFNENVKTPKKEKNGPEWDGAYLFTRLESLSKLKDTDCDKFKIYTLKEEIIFGESAISDDSNMDGVIFDEKEGADSNVDVPNNASNQYSYPHQDIHAKIYFVRKGSQIDLYLGSLNASHNAFKGNVEFMIHLRTNYRKFDLKKLKNDLFCGEEGGPKSPFQWIEEVSKYVEPEPERDLDSIFKGIAHLNLKSIITQEDEFYKINLNVSNFSFFEKKYFTEDLDIYINPLLFNDEKKIFSENVSFEKLKLDNLSAFFVITIEYKGVPKSRVIKIETEGLPEDRKKEVISSKIEDVADFKRYVALILGEDLILDFDKDISTRNGENGDDPDHQIQIQFTPLYEKMLVAAVHNKDKFKEIEYLIQTLSGTKAIPEGFEELYNTFKEVVDNE